MKIVTFGEIMLRLAPPGHLRFSQASQFDAVYGGGEANVAVSLAHFGDEAHFATRLPDNELGQCAEMHLRKYGVRTDHIVRGGERLGLYFIEVGAVQRGSNVVYDRMGSGMATLEPGMIEWEEVLQGADLFHWSGITPAISQSAADACQEAIQVANRLNVPVSVDLNYRKTLWQYGKQPSEIMPDLVEGCDIILGNQDEATAYFGLDMEEVKLEPGTTIDGNRYRDILAKIHDHFPRCKLTVASLRAAVSANHNSWSGALYDGSELYTTRTYQITHIVDRVGGGDSFMAGILYGFLHFGGDHQKTLDFATAASCLKHTIYGDANLVGLKEVTRLMEGDDSGRVKR